MEAKAEFDRNNDYLVAALSFMVKRLNLNSHALSKKPEVSISQRMIDYILSGQRNAGRKSAAQLAAAVGIDYMAALHMGRLMVEDGVPGEEALEQARRTVFGVGNVTLRPPEIDAKGNVVPPVANTEPVPLPERSRRVPLISFVLASNWGEVVDNFAPGDAEDWIECSSRVGPRAFALKVKGPSMEPEFREGELIVVDPDIEAQSGDYVVAKNGDEEATFKRYLKDGDKHYLCPLNDRFQMMDMTGRPWRIVGRVMEKQKRY